MDTQDLHGRFKPWPEFSACHRWLDDMVLDDMGRKDILLGVEQGDRDPGSRCGVGPWWNCVSLLAQTQLFMDAHPDHKCFIPRCGICRSILSIKTNSDVAA